MFELTEVTQVTITNANPRRELHGDEKVRAIDLTFSLKGNNTLLDLIQPGLCKHHYCNHAADAQQVELPDVETFALPNLRFPKLPTKYRYGGDDKLRGYRFMWDWGIEADHMDFQDCVLTSMQYEIFEGGSVTITGSIQYNGDELGDNDVYGELSGLASEGDIFIKLLAPGEAMQAKKGYRAGKPDTPPVQENPAQQEFEVEHDDPEKAMKRAHGAE